MFGASRNSLLVVQDALRTSAQSGDVKTLSGQLFAVADVIAQEKSLRQILADSGQTPQSRSALIAEIFGSSIDEVAKSVVSSVVSQRWSTDGDLIDVLEILGAQAAFIAADRNGTLDRAESDIFHFGRTVDASASLQMTLTDPSLSTVTKTKVVNQLLDGKVEQQTIAVIAYFVSHLRGRRVDAVIELLNELAAAQRNQVVAYVRSVVALDESQLTRLTNALNKLTGKQVSVNVAIDPSVIGGITVKIGQDVIDGSVATRLENARRSLLA